MAIHTQAIMQGLLRITEDIWKVVFGTNDDELLMADPRDSMIGTSLEEIRPQMVMKYPMSNSRYCVLGNDVFPLAPVYSGTDYNKPPYETRALWGLTYPHIPFLANHDDLELLGPSLEAAGPVLVHLESGGSYGRNRDGSLKATKEKYDEFGYSVKLAEVSVPDLQEALNVVGVRKGQYDIAGTRFAQVTFSQNGADRRRAAATPVVTADGSKAEPAVRKPSVYDAISVYSIESFYNRVCSWIPTPDRSGIRFWSPRNSKDRINTIKSCLGYVERMYGKGCYRSESDYRDLMKKVLDTEYVTIKKFWSLDPETAEWLLYELNSKYCRLLRAGKQEELATYLSKLPRIGGRRDFDLNIKSQEKDWLPKILRPKPKKKPKAKKKTKRKSKTKREVVCAQDNHDNENRDSNVLQLSGAH